jgi:hypothetical protein
VLRLDEVGSTDGERTGIFASARKLVVGNGLGQALQLAALPLLSRVYLPDQFGQLGNVQAEAAVLVILVTLQMHLSVHVSRTDEEVKRRVRTLDSLSALWVALLLPVALVTGFLFTASWGLAAILAVANTHTSVLVHRGRFGVVSLLATLRGLAIVGFQLALVPIGPQHGLVIGALLGEFLAALALRTASGGFTRVRLVSVREALETARALRAFSVYGTLQELVSVAAFYAPVLLYVAHFGTEPSGQYVMSSRLVWAPVVLFSGSIAQVLYHRLGQTPPRDVAALRALTPPTSLVLLLLGGGALTFYLQPLYEAILGPGWGLAGRMIPLQVVWGVAFLFSLPARVLCRVSQLQWMQLLVDLGTLTAIVLAFEVFEDPVEVMTGLAGIGVAQNLLLTVLVLGAVHRRVAR